MYMCTRACVKSVSRSSFQPNSSGSLLDEPLSLERSSTPLSLCAPTSDPDQPCRLQVDFSSLRGYTSSQVGLTSTSRTTELYQDGDEYVGTVRGSEAGNCNSNGYAPTKLNHYWSPEPYTLCIHRTVQKLYCCDHNLPSDGVHQIFTIKVYTFAHYEHQAT